MQDFKEITTIVPKLPPEIDGLGDYSLQLAQQLFADQGWQTNFIVGDPNWRGNRVINHSMRASVVSSRSTEALSAQLPSPDRVVLLHYAGHGYAKRGCPVWLVQALAEWCRAGGRLITMFHELYATGPLLSSAVLTSPIQKRLAVLLMEISDRAITSRQLYAEKIRILSHQKHTDVISLPVFSNFGETLHPKPLQDRSRQLVIFGNSKIRQRIYQQASALKQVCQNLQIQTVVDIGAVIDLQPDVDGVPIRRLGIQPADQIDEILSDAIAAVIDYPTAYLAKSSVFAGYCSHGILPIVLSSRLENQDGLKMNVHYWLANGADRILDLDQAQAIATATHTWYQQHNLKTQAQYFAEKLLHLQG